MNPVYVISDNIISPLGKTSAENFAAVVQGLSGIRTIDNKALSPQPFYASIYNEVAEDREKYTRFENYCIASITNALAKTGVALSSADTVFILSTTKGNVELLENAPFTDELKERLSLFNTAKKITQAFNGVNEPVVLSNACISGALAVLVAKRLLQSGQYKHAVVTGADVLSRFIVSGFQSLHAMSAEECKPFDKNRTGINLGECAATIVLSTTEQGKVLVNGGASSNDANHISGPSRTGHELAYAVTTAMQESNVTANDLAFVSAHGTATVYNDEMEGKAFAHAGLSAIPLHSLKGHFGHTLGAAGVLESILTYHSLLNGLVLPSRNYTEHGVSENVTISKQLEKTNKSYALKTASGFGGCNAALIYSIT